ncbi:hypothetical protein Pcinc_005564 [Petrolisthes cinctipes]|uniref:Uncharacterized protein n=1 Tax=Petrolisthes cinctipes TaxID=88211 RepID=A0AAE1KZ41_PETCI|nr:hypothetical protein Pcinc_005564 [Petrolisthes cinctipes]
MVKRSCLLWQQKSELAERQRQPTDQTQHTDATMNATLASVYTVIRGAAQAEQTVGKNNRRIYLPMQAPFCYVHVSFLVSGGESELGYGKVPPPARPWPWLRPRSRSSQGQDKGHGWGGGDERGHQTPPVNTPRNWRLTSPVVWGHRGSCLDARYTALAASVYAILGCESRAPPPPEGAALVSGT